jgi:hypothetical protein
VAQVRTSSELLTASRAVGRLTNVTTARAAVTVERTLSWAAPGLFVVAVTFFGARVFAFLPLDGVRIALMGQLALVVCYMVLALYRLHLGVFAAGVALIMYVLAEHVWFSSLAHAAPNYNAMASYLPIMAFVVFSESRASFNDLLRIVLIVAVGYLIVYVVGQDFLARVNANSIALLPATPGRPSRLYLLGSWATFVAFYGLMASRMHIVARAGLILLALAALVLSGSRTLQALFVVFFLVGALEFTGWRSRLGIFACVMIVTLLMLGGLVVESWNPYDLMNWDASARYRGASYPRVIAGIQQYWAFGVGLPADSETLSQFLRIPRDQLLFPSDLGTAGMVFMLGVPGLLLCCAVIGFAFFGAVAAKTRSASVAALRLNVMLGAAITWMSPMLLAEPTAIFLGLAIALAIRRRRQNHAY